ncbi:MAG: diguanylate cyclase, partial [Adlercreutzia sp.]|nr:diguanylate cyclase [Adlercreutzia sp.]
MNIVRRRVMNTLMLYQKQRTLMGMVADQVYEREKSNNLMVYILSHIVEFRNGESGMHVLNVQAMTEMILTQLMRLTDQYPLTTEDISLITMASSLHDIGKIAIPEEILNKPGRFTDE